MRIITPHRILILLILSAILSGCAKDGSLSRWGECALIGGGTGGLLGAVDSTEAAGWGALGGAILGGTLCALRGDDTDKDGIYNKKDECPGTPPGVKVDSRGCPIDSDGDGVPDYLDLCPNTPVGLVVNEDGCPDSDNDGVADNIDQCPDTPTGAIVDARGCPTDSDNDGIYDGIDQCLNTPSGTPVDNRGCPINNDLGDITFDFDKIDLKGEAITTLHATAAALKREPHTKLCITGYTDNRGVESYNNTLALKRAESAKKYLVSQGVDAQRIVTETGGVINRGNETKAGRRHNRKANLMAVR